MLHKSLERVFKDMGKSPKGIVLDHLELIAFVLSMIPESMEYISDLKHHLVVSHDEAFITSDSPVYIYNQYCEGIRDRGITGLTSRGLQMFVPLSPHLILILYDGWAYKVRSLTDRRACRSFAKRRSDIDQLNLVQMLSAERNVYFAGWEQRKDIESLLPAFQRVKLEDPQSARAFQENNDLKGSLFVTFERMVDMSLNLSFLAIRNNVNEIPLQRRADLYRVTRERVMSRRNHELDELTRDISRFVGRD